MKRKLPRGSDLQVPRMMRVASLDIVGECTPFLYGNVRLMLSGARFRASGIRTHHSFATERPAAGRLSIHLLLFYTNAYSNFAAIPDHGSDDACLRHYRLSHGSCRSDYSRRTGTTYRSIVTWSISFDHRCRGPADREWGCEEEGGGDGTPGIERSQ